MWKLLSNTLIDLIEFPEDLQDHIEGMSFQRQQSISRIDLIFQIV